MNASSTSPGLSSEGLPWAPLYSITRSGQVETTVYGVAFVWAEQKAAQNNSGLALLRAGNTKAPLWSRSLLKPFQLMVLYPSLKQAYPDLTSAHFAMLMASHQAETEQLKLLREIMAIGGLQESDLQCPACKNKHTQENCALNHPCSGKHLAHLLYLKAKGMPTNNYLESGQEPYQLLRELLCYLLYVDEVPESTDGCGMPNFSLSAVEVAQLYHALISPVSRDMIRQCPDELTESLSHWDEIAALMQKHPELIGGSNRLDTRLMQHALPGQEVVDPKPKLIAKEGADGLLCLGIGPSSPYPDGIGILLKLSSGNSTRHLETLIQHILEALSLASESDSVKQEHEKQGVTETIFHFSLSGVKQPV